MSHHSHKHRKKFMLSAGYYIVVVVLLACLLFMVKINRSNRTEREEYKTSLSKEETVEDLGNITITKPTDAPENAVSRSSDEDTADNTQEDTAESDKKQEEDSN